jgi:hypothetical protein
MCSAPIDQEEDEYGTCYVCTDVLFCLYHVTSCNGCGETACEMCTKTLCDGCMSPSKGEDGGACQECHRLYYCDDCLGADGRCNECINED